MHILNIKFNATNASKHLTDQSEERILLIESKKA